MHVVPYQFQSVVSAIREFTWIDCLDILLVSVVFYYFLLLVRGTRAIQVLRGLVVLLFVYALTNWTGLDTFHYLIGQLLLPGVIALVILFQPELRLALERLGGGRRLGFSSHRRTLVTQTINESVDAVEQLSARRFGALVVFAREAPTEAVEETGTRLDSPVSSELIRAVFQPGAPLHDGAVVIRDNRVLAAACILPLSENLRLPSGTGTRHRAALGITEESDAVVAVVSEETGRISLASEGRLEANLQPEVLKERLLAIFREEDRDHEEPAGAGRRRKRP